MTMPFSQVDGQKVEMHMDAGQAGDMSHCGSHHDGNQQSKNVPCDKCFSCYLSAAQAIIPFSISVELSGAGPMVSGLIAEIPDTVPSSLFHPPRSIFA